MNSVTVNGMTYRKRDDERWEWKMREGKWLTVVNADYEMFIDALLERDEAILKCVTTSDGQGMENIRLQDALREIADTTMLIESDTLCNIIKVARIALSEGENDET